MTTETTATEVNAKALKLIEDTGSGNQSAIRELIVSLNAMDMSVATGEATLKKATSEGYVIDGLSSANFRHIKTACAIFSSEKLTDSKGRHVTARQVMGLARRVNDGKGLNSKEGLALIASAEDWTAISDEVKAPRKAGKTASEKEADNKATITSLDNVGQVLTDIFNSLTTQEGRTKFLSILDSTSKTLKAYNASLARDTKVA